MAALRRTLKLLPSIHISTVKPPTSVHKSFSSSSSSSSSSPILSRRQARSAIKSTSDPDHVASILRSSSFIDRDTYRFAVAKLGRLGRKDLVEQLLEPMRKGPEEPDERTLVHVMTLYSFAGMIDDVVRTFEDIPNPSEKSLCALLACFLHNRLPGRARECFTRVPKELGLVPGISAWNLYLNALCDDGDLGTATDYVLGKLHAENGVEPDIFSHNILLNVYLKKGDEDNFNAIIKEITKKNLQADVITYNNRITMLCRKKKVGDAETVFEEMLSSGIKPNSISYNTLLTGFCNEGDLSSAKKLFDKLCAENQGGGMVAVDAGSHVMLMRLMLEKGEVGMALEMCKKCLRKKWAPPFDVLRVLVDQLVKDSKVDEAQQMVKQMKPCVYGPALDAWIKFESTLPLF